MVFNLLLFQYDFLLKFNLDQKLNKVCVSNSKLEPTAISIKCVNCASIPLPYPLAILLGIDTAYRRMCEFNPNLSSLGKILVEEYTSFNKLLDLFLTSNFLKSFILFYLVFSIVFDYLYISICKKTLYYLILVFDTEYCII